MDELTQAADRGYTLEVRKLAAEGFGVNGAGGDGPLHLTAYNGHAETAKALLELCNARWKVPSLDSAACHCNSRPCR
jgi:hypothetical protein